MKNPYLANCTIGTCCLSNCKVGSSYLAICTIGFYYLANCPIRNLCVGVIGGTFTIYIGEYFSYITSFLKNKINKVKISRNSSKFGKKLWHIDATIFIDKVFFSNNETSLQAKSNLSTQNSQKMYFLSVLIDFLRVSKILYTFDI